MRVRRTYVLKLAATPAFRGRTFGLLPPAETNCGTSARAKGARAAPRMLVSVLTYIPTPRFTVAVRLPVRSIRCCALPEDDLSAVRAALERTLMLKESALDTSDTSDDTSRFQEPNLPSSGDTFRFQEPSSPPIDDMATGLAEVQDLGERVGGLAWLGLTFWVNLPGMQYLVLGAFLLFGALCSMGEFGGVPGRFVAHAPRADEGAYYRWTSPGVTDESVYVLDGAGPRGAGAGQ